MIGAGTVCEFLGSLSGGEVANTISGGILNMKNISEHQYILCMFATMAGAFVWLAIATLYSLPVSTTHSLIGALVGVGLVEGGLHGVQWDGVLKIGMLACLLACLFKRSRVMVIVFEQVIRG